MTARWTDADAAAAASRELDRIERGDLGAEEGVAEWERPVALDMVAVPPFPLDALDPLAEFVGAVAEAVQVPADLPAGLALAVVAATIARKCRVAVRGKYSEPVNLYTLTVLEPGNRKSSTVELVTAPLFACEAHALAQAEPDVAAAESQRRIHEAERGNLERDAAKLNAGAEEREKARRAALALARELAATAPSVRPRLVVKDVTPEQVGALLGEQGGVLACFSGESDLFGPMLGRYAKDGQANLDVFLSAHSGDPIRIDRRGAKPVTVERPALTIGVSVQPAALHALTRDKTVRGRGLLGRFLYALPRSPLGYRDTEPAAIPDAIDARWSALVQQLATLPRPAVEHAVTLSSEAYGIWHAYEDSVEPELRPDGRFGTMTDWAGKLCGATARLAGVLHAATQAAALRTPWEDPIPAETMRAAVRLGDFYAAHALAAFGLMGADPAVEAARRILAWLSLENIPTFSTRDAYRENRGLTPAAARLGLAELVERGWVRPAVNGRGNGRPSERWVTIPSLVGGVLHP